MKTNITKFPAVAIARIHIVPASAGPGPTSVPRREDTQPRTRARIILFNRGLTDKKAGHASETRGPQPCRGVDRVDRTQHQDRDVGGIRIAHRRGDQPIHAGRAKRKHDDDSTE
jgi:hypothetical protein